MQNELYIVADAIKALRESRGLTRWEERRVGK